MEEYLTPEIGRLLDLSLVRRGGYPFRKNDLTMEEWRALGVIQEEYEQALGGARVAIPTPAPEPDPEPEPKSSWGGK